MLIEERHHLIIEELESNNKVLVNELSLKLNVSVDTIRRDLIILENEGLLKRTHGGAIPVRKVRVKHPRNYTVKDVEEIDPCYEEIAKEAVQFIKPEDTIYIGGSIISYTMLKHLPKDICYTVVTNSIITADELRPLENIEVYIACGKLRGHGTMNDSLTIEFIKNMRIDKAFISGPCISASFGLSNSTFETANLQRNIIQSSKQVICLASNSKIGVEAFAKITDAKDIDILITDSEALDDEISKLTNLGIKVIVAKN